MRRIFQHPPSNIPHINDDSTTHSPNVNSPFTMPPSDKHPTNVTTTNEYTTSTSTSKPGTCYNINASVVNIDSPYKNNDSDDDIDEGSFDISSQENNTTGTYYNFNAIFLLLFNTIIYINSCNIDSCINILLTF